MTGRPLEQLRENGWLDFVHPEDVDRCLATYMPAFEARKPFLLEYRLRHADGDYRWFLASGVPKYGRDGSFTGYVGCDIDITERKNAEDRIRASQAALEASHQEIQYLAGRLIEAQEVERARIARDLHDDVSQQLAGVSIAFSGLKQRLGDYHVSEELRQELVELQQQTLKLARNVRQLSHDLHPAVLQHLGLVKGLTSYCGELGRAHGVAMTCTAEGDFGVITPDAALCVYRIAQETLRNVIAHAGASGVQVRLLRWVTMRRSRSRTMDGDLMPPTAVTGRRDSGSSASPSARGSSEAPSVLCRRCIRAHGCRRRFRCTRA